MSANAHRAIRPRPLWGFGWVGWCLLPVLCGLVWVYATGYDLRYHLLRLIDALWGFEGNVVFVAWVLPAYLQDWPGYGLSLISWGALMAALYVSPLRISRWACVVLTLWVMLRPLAWWALIGLAFHRSPTGFGLKSTSFVSWQTASLLVPLTVDVALVGWATRSRIASLAALAAWGAVAAFHLMTGSNSLGPPRVISRFDGWLAENGRYLAQAAFSIAVLWWAIKARRAVPPPWSCPDCGYDLRGILSGRCPECGKSDAPDSIPA